MNIKNILKNIVKILPQKLTINDIKVDTITTENVVITANGTVWSSATVPSNRKMLACVGFYWTGTNGTNLTPYCFRQDLPNHMQCALRNWSNSQATVTVFFSYIYVDVVGGVTKLLTYLSSLFNRRVVMA